MWRVVFEYEGATMWSQAFRCELHAFAFAEKIIKQMVDEGYPAPHYRLEGA